MSGFMKARAFTLYYSGYVLVQHNGVKLPVYTTVKPTEKREPKVPQTPEDYCRLNKAEEKRERRRVRNKLQELRMIGGKADAPLKALLKDESTNQRKEFYRSITRLLRVIEHIPVGKT